MRQAILLLVAAAFSLGGVARLMGADAPPGDQASAAQAEAAALVQRLGDEQFATRELATTQLIQIGLAAKTALEQGRTHADREIRYRCERILSIIEELEFQRRLAAFAAGRSGAEYALPGWKRYSASYGDDGEARTLFVEMQKAEPDLMRVMDDGPQAVSRAFDIRCLQLQQSQRASGQTLGLGSIAALLFSVDDEHLTLNFQSVAVLSNFCYQAPVASAMEDPAKRKILGKMLGAWIKRSEGWAAYQSLSLAMRYDLKEGLVPAVKILQNVGEQPYVRQNAILAVAKLGDDSHLPLLEKLLDDKSRCATQRVNNVTIETQLRDVALAALLIMKKQEPRQFGFERLQLNATNVLIAGTVGFETEEKRNAAFAKWKAFQATQQKPP